jgi:hypothetical protein
MPNTYQQCFQQPQWNASTGAMLCDATVNVTLAGITQPLPAGSNLLGTMGVAIPAGATPFNVRATSTANTAVTATKAAGTGAQQNYLLGYQVCLRGAAAAVDTAISLKDGSTEKIYDVFGAAAPVGTRCQLASAVPIVAGTAATAMTLTVAAGGAGAIVELSMWGYTV